MTNRKPDETDGRPRRLDPEDRTRLATWLADAIDAQAVEISDLSVLSGGAIGENWRLFVTVRGGQHDGTHDWVLRTDAVAANSLSLNRAQEYAALGVAHAAGVRVPSPIVRCESDDLLGAPFMVVGFEPGTASGRSLVGHHDVAQWGPTLLADLGTQLARLHAITPANADAKAALSFLAFPNRTPARQLVSEMRAALDQVAEPRPALELVLAWLDANAPDADGLSLVHGDFRTGNYLVDLDGAPPQLSSVLDWEFAHWGDRHEDIGYFCARCWRFGGDELGAEREAGGIGPRAALIQGYNAEAERLGTATLDPGVLAYWEAMGNARWAVIALMQGERYWTGGEASLELVLTGMMAPEMEWDALDAIGQLDGDWALQADHAMVLREDMTELDEEIEDDIADAKPSERQFANLAALACQTIQQQVRPHVTDSHARYALAMAVNAIRVLERARTETEFATSTMFADEASAICGLPLPSDANYEDGTLFPDAGLNALSERFRAGLPSDAALSDIVPEAYRLLAGQLSVRNAKFLKRRLGRGADQSVGA